jgi:hypothetical protein
VEVSVTRRICLTGAAIAAGALALSVGSAMAAKSKHHTVKPAKPKPVSVSCKWAVTGVAPSDQLTFTPGSETGDQYGTSSCPGPEGKGLAHLTFSLQDSGDLDGSWWESFGTGTVRGTYVLTPSDDGTLDPSTFSSASYAGTLEVTGATGGFKGAAGKGTLVCSSADSVHVKCTAGIKFSQLVPPVSG